MLLQGQTGGFLRGISCNSFSMKRDHFKNDEKEYTNHSIYKLTKSLFEESMNIELWSEL